MREKIWSIWVFFFKEARMENKETQGFNYLTGACQNASYFFFEKGSNYHHFGAISVPLKLNIK
jgi:hypothetical protein